MAPRAVSDEPVQVLGYMTTLPDPSDFADDMSFFGRSTSPSFCTIPETMERLNKFLKKKPIPGRLNIVLDMRVLAHCMLGNFFLVLLSADFFHN